MIQLDDTTSSAIAAQFVRGRMQAGSPAMGMVMTLVVVTDEERADEAMAAARNASHEHPARVLGLILGSGRGAPCVDAQVGIGDGWSGEHAMIRLRGEVVKHADSVVRPLLLPDSPVVIWWAGDAPANPAGNAIGALGNRRITDAAEVTATADVALRRRARYYTPGDTDLAWTRCTGWRALLAAALDQYPAQIVQASVSAERENPSGDLLAAWLADRLDVPVTRVVDDGPGVTEVLLRTAQDEIRLTRPDAARATLSIPGGGDRLVALRRRSTEDLLAEELRRLDEDEIFAATLGALTAIDSPDPDSSDSPAPDADRVLP